MICLDNSRYELTLRDGRKIQSSSIEALLPDEDLEEVAWLEESLLPAGMFRTVSYTLQRLT